MSYSICMAPENVIFLIYSWDLIFDWMLLQVPILELLVHMHSKSGDQERVSALITLLQQPALNVHNPQSIRLAHVASLEQRFLQRLCGELLWSWCWRVLASLLQLLLSDNNLICMLPHIYKSLIVELKVSVYVHLQSFLFECGFHHIQLVPNLLVIALYVLVDMVEDYPDARYTTVWLPMKIKLVTCRQKFKLGGLRIGPMKQSLVAFGNRITSGACSSLGCNI